MTATDRLPDPARLRRLYALAAASFLPAILFYYVGEEAIFPITSLEMWHAGDWIRQHLYGRNLQHNPLLNWLVIAAASLVGWEHMLAVTRAITIAATVGAGFVLAWLCRTLYRDAAFAAFAALVYLTLADAFFYRGWLAYADPLFAFFVSGAIACLWVACERRSAVLLALAVASLTCAFMTKALTAYVFYGAAAAVLLARTREHRAFLLGPASWALHAAALALALAWFYALPENTGQGGRMFAEILHKLGFEGFGAYAVKLVAYPLESFARLAPAALVAAYLVWRRGAPVLDAADGHRRTALWIVLLNFLPYWLAPQSATRYLMPLYPLAGLVLARILWNTGAPAVALALRWLVAAIVLKLVFVLAVYPAYQHWYRGKNYETAARDIHALAAGHPIYATNVAASGLSVVAHLDVLRLPAPPVAWPPAEWESGFVIAYAPDPALGRVARTWRLGGNELYLLCRGSACDAAPR